MIVTERTELKILIATFNLESLDDRPDALPPFAARVPVLRRMLTRLNADVLCLQEIAARHGEDKHGPRWPFALDAILEGTPYAGFERLLSQARDGRGPLDVHNLAILSRLPMVETRQYWHDLVPPVPYELATAARSADAAIEWERPVLYAAVATAADRAVHIFNLHLRAPLASFVPGQKESPFVWRTVSGWAEGFFVAAIKRAGQALETRRALDSLFDRDPNALVTVCGDMNAEEHEIPLRILCAGTDDTGSTALAGRALVPVERGLPASQRFSVLHDGRPMMLDHVLASHAMLERCRSVEIFNDRLEDEAHVAADHPSPESYHAPVVATFEI